MTWVSIRLFGAVTRIASEVPKHVLKDPFKVWCAECEKTYTLQDSRLPGPAVGSKEATNLQQLLLLRHATQKTLDDTSVWFWSWCADMKESCEEQSIDLFGEGVRFDCLQ